MRTTTFMRTALMFMFAFFIAGVTSVSAEKKKEKKKKEKKPIEWVMPELTGDETFDDFLKECDTLYTRMQTIEKEVPFYEVRKIINTETGDSIVAVVDSIGTIRSSSLAYQQYLDAIESASNLILDFAVISTSTAAATTALPSLGMKAFTYGKYIKTGGQLAIQCPAKLKEMIQKFTVQRNAIRAYKKDFDEKTGKIKDPSVNPDSLEALNLGEKAALNKSTEQIAAELADADKVNEGINIDDLLGS